MKKIIFLGFILISCGATTEESVTSSVEQPATTEEQETTTTQQETTTTQLVTTTTVQDKPQLLFSQTEFFQKLKT